MHKVEHLREVAVAIIGAGAAGLAAAHVLATEVLQYKDRDLINGGEARSERGCSQ